MAKSKAKKQKAARAKGAKGTAARAAAPSKSGSGPIPRPNVQTQNPAPATSPNTIPIGFPPRPGLPMPPATTGRVAFAASKVKGVGRATMKKQAPGLSQVTNFKQISVWANLMHAKEILEERELHENLGSPATPISVCAVIFLKFWPKFGGLGNLIYREGNRRTILREILSTAEYSPIIAFAQQHQPDDFETLDDIVELVSEYLKYHMYTSDLARSFNFSWQDHDHILLGIGDQNNGNNGFEMPQEEIPEICLETIFNFLLKPLKQGFYEHINSERPDALRNIGVWNYGNLILETTIWKWMFQDMRDPVFLPQHLEDLQEKVVNIRNMPAHGNRITAEYMVECVELAKYVLQSIRQTPGQNKIDIPDEAGLPRLNQWLNAWIVGIGKSKEESWYKLRNDFSLLPQDHGSMSTADKDNLQTSKDDLALRVLMKRCADAATEGQILANKVLALSRGEPVEDYVWGRKIAHPTPRIPLSVNFHISDQKTPDTTPDQASTQPSPVKHIMPDNTQSSFGSLRTILGRGFRSLGSWLLKGGQSSKRVRSDDGEELEERARKRLRGFTSSTSYLDTTVSTERAGKAAQEEETEEAVDELSAVSGGFSPLIGKPLSIGTALYNGAATDHRRAAWGGVDEEVVDSITDDDKDGGGDIDTDEDDVYGFETDGGEEWEGEVDEDILESVEMNSN